MEIGLANFEICGGYIFMVVKVVAMHLSTELNFDKEMFFELEQQASDAYNRFTYRDYDEFDMVRRFLFERRLCEFCPPFGRVLIEEGHVVAMMACLSAEDLVRCRTLAALAMSQLDCCKRNRELQKRVRLASTTLIRPQEGDFYLARIAVVKNLGRHGIGRHLLGRCEAEAKKRAYRRLILEVDPRNEAALSLYRQASFQDGDVHGVADPESGRSLEYLHMAKTLRS